jgi:Ribosomal protein L5
MNSRLEKIYKEEVVPALMKQFGYTNPMEVPKLVKITLNMGVGEAATNKKILENAVADMAKVSGQKPVVTKSRSRWRRSRSAMVGRSAARPLCVVKRCMSSWTA